MSARAGGCLSIAVKLWGGFSHVRDLVEESVLSVVPCLFLMLGCCLELRSINAPFQNFCAGHLQM